MRLSGVTPTGRPSARRSLVGVVPEACRERLGLGRSARKELGDACRLQVGRVPVLDRVHAPWTEVREQDLEGRHRRLVQVRGVVDDEVERGTAELGGDDLRQPRSVGLVHTEVGLDLVADPVAGDVVGERRGPVGELDGHQLLGIGEGVEQGGAAAEPDTELDDALGRRRSNSSMYSSTSARGFITRGRPVLLDERERAVELERSHPQQRVVHEGHPVVHATIVPGGPGRGRCRRTGRRRAVLNRPRSSRGGAGPGSHHGREVGFLPGRAPAGSGQADSTRRNPSGARPARVWCSAIEGNMPPAPRRRRGGRRWAGRRRAGR